jgi:staphyloferrin B biosynthesis citrate synthase
MMLPMNPIRARIAGGGVALGLIVRAVRSGDIALIARASDHDFLFIDTQHAAFNRESVANIIIAARGAGVSPLVRVRSYADPDAALWLDAGAGGLIVPDVNTAEEARALVKRCRFPPRGQRSLPGTLIQDDFRPAPPNDAMRRADAETVLVAMIETPRGVENAAEIAAVDGIDVLHVGCVDLLLALGRPGQQGCPEILEAIETVANATERHGKILGIGGERDPERRAAFIGKGAGFMTTDLDTNLLLEATTARVAAIRKMETR